jgi:uncharacterized RDD family membrane protein YckC
MARDVTRLTRTGTIQGTPQFAAPEQLRGDPLDVRSDIYAVGATLYYLLTGRPPFDDTDLIALLTRVATEVPRSPRDVVRAVPRGLATIVLRCLAKDRASRPATYAALEEALKPFGSIAPTMATMGSRVAASVIDQILLFEVVIVTLRLTGGEPSVLMPACFTLMAGYFTMTEGLTGASVGKWFFGLRVTDVEGGKPGLVGASVRTALFVLAALQPFLIRKSLLISSFPQFMFVTLLCLLFPFALFLTARRRHGFAGLHELLSGTRVTVYAHPPRIAETWTVLSNQVQTSQTRDDRLSLATRGPFVLLESFESTGTASVGLGFDQVLNRHVWIREAPIGAPLSDAARRDLARPGRLRWLAGKQTPNGTWEAFEAPRGASIISRTAAKQPWRSVRQWLADLAAELLLCQREGRVPVLELNRVWITPEGRAKLLDFASPGTAQTEDSSITQADDKQNIKAFLSKVAWTALLGRVQHVSEALPITQPPLPPSGTAVLRALRQPGDLQDLVDLCRLALQTPSHVTRRSRALLPAIVVMTVLGMIAFSPFRYWRDVGPAGVAQDNRALFNSLVRIERLRESAVLESNPERRALEVYVARRYAPLSARRSYFSYCPRAIFRNTSTGR